MALQITVMVLIFDFYILSFMHIICSKFHVNNFFGCGILASLSTTDYTRMYNLKESLLETLTIWGG